MPSTYILTTLRRPKLLWSCSALRRRRHEHKNKYVELAAIFGLNQHNSMQSTSLILVSLQFWGLHSKINLPCLLLFSHRVSTVSQFLSFLFTLLFTQCRSYVCDLFLRLPFSFEVCCWRNLPLEEEPEFLLEPAYLSHSFYTWNICSRDTVLSRTDVATGIYGWKNTALKNF